MPPTVPAPGGIPFMNRFCGDCGAARAPGDRFCGVCGAALAAGRAGPAPDEKGRLAWLGWLEGGWLDPSATPPTSGPGGPRGILLTNHRLLQAQGTRMDGWLARFVSRRHDQAGVSWHVLDAGDELGLSAEVDDYVAFLAHHRKRLVRDAGDDPVPVLLFGSESVIPMAVLEDPANTGNDGDIDTDLPYALQGSRNGWSSLLEGFHPCSTVGRIPVGTHFGAAHLEAYLDACGLMATGQATESVFGLSARCWEGASRAVHADVSGEDAGPLHLSPTVETGTVRGLLDPRGHWHYFNLHGSDADPHWFGQDEGSYPRAWHPDLFRHLDAWNMVGVEACYGARFIGHAPEKSALLSALGHRTVAFVGSSRIAYGPPDPPEAYADLVIRDFLKAARSGLPTGEALSQGHLSVLGQDLGDPDLIVKTVLEFNLFGDPLVRLPGAPSWRSPTPTAKRLASGISVPKVERIGRRGVNVLGEVLRMVEGRAAALQHTLDLALGRYPGLQATLPRVSRITFPARHGRPDPDQWFRFHYLAPKSTDRIPLEVLVYCDSNGALRQVVEAKGRVLSAPPISGTSG